MIEPRTIQKLKASQHSPFQILSVYLGAGSVQSPTGEYMLTELHSLLHQNLNHEQRQDFAPDIKRIQDFLASHVPRARTLAIFSAGDDLWEVVSLEFSLPADLCVDSSPNIEPLLTAAKKYKPYMVILVDREKARMFTVAQGEVTAHAEFFTDGVPQMVAATGKDGMTGKSDINFRHNQVLLRRHIANAASAIATFIKGKTINFVILGGHREMFKEVAKALPSTLQPKVIGEFVTEVDLPLPDLLRQSKQIAAANNVL